MKIIVATLKFSKHSDDFNDVYKHLKLSSFLVFNGIVLAEQKSLNILHKIRRNLYLAGKKQFCLTSNLGATFNENRENRKPLATVYSGVRI